MRCVIKELMDHLGVGYILSAYETSPWSAHDDDEGLTCSAEVRMGAQGDELEAEIQFMYDDPKPDQKAIEQIFWLLAKPATGEKWDIKTAKVKGENKSEDIFQWEEKSVEFFHACVQELIIGNIPDIDSIYERIINRKDKFSGSRGGGGRKAPKIKPAHTPGMKGGGR